MSRTLSGVVAAINSFRGQMEQIIFDSNNLLRPATLFEDVKVSLFNHANISHPSLEVMCVFCVFFTRCTTFCHSLSFIVVVIPCHSLNHPLPFVVTRCLRCHLLYYSLSLNAPLVYLFINDMSTDPVRIL